MDSFEIDVRGQDLMMVRNTIYQKLWERHARAIAEIDAGADTKSMKVSAQARFTVVVKGATSEFISVIQGGLAQVDMLFPVKLSFKEIQPSVDFDIHL